jgi:hypothetical protein
MADPSGNGSPGVVRDPGWGTLPAAGRWPATAPPKTELDLINTSFGGSSWGIQSIGSGVAQHTGDLEFLNDARPI